MRHAVFYKNMFWQYGLQALRYVLPLVLIPYLTRVLGTDGYAVYSYVLSFMGVIQVIADFGFTLSGTKKVIEVKKDKKALSQLVGDISAARLMLLAVLLVATMVITQFIPIMAENQLYVFLAFIVVSMRSLLPDFVFQGFEHMGPLTTRYFASKSIQIVLTFLFVHSSSDLLLVVGADMVGSLIGLIWSFVAQKRLFGVGISKPSVRQTLVELKDSAIYCISNVSSSLFSGFTTIIIGIALTDRADIAFWSLTLTTVTAVQSLYGPIVNSLYPHMLNNRDYGFVRKIALLALPALIAGTFAYCLLSKQIALVLGGSEYLGAAQVMVMISPIFFFSFYGTLIGWPMLGALGYVRQLTETTVVTGVVNVVALLVLYATGNVNLTSLCVTRWLIDAFMLATRMFALWRLSKRDEIGHPKETIPSK